MNKTLILTAILALSGCVNDADREPKCIKSQTAIIPAVRCDKQEHITGSSYLCYESTKRIQQCMEYADNKS